MSKTRVVKTKSKCCKSCPRCKRCPVVLQRIEAADGRILWKTDAVRDLVMDPQDAYMMTSMLRSVVDHPGPRTTAESSLPG